MTAYPWFASDVTFPGSILLVALIAYALVASYRDAVLTRNPFAVLSFTWLLYMVASFPQGSITQDGSVVMAFAASIVFWRASRKYVAQKAPVRQHPPALPAPATGER